MNIQSDENGFISIVESEFKPAILHTKEKKKWNIGHFPVGTVGMAKFDFGDNKEEFQFVVKEVVSSGASNWCIKVTKPDSDSESSYNIFNIDYVTEIISRGEGKDYAVEGFDRIHRNYLRDSLNHGKRGKKGSLIDGYQIAFFLILPYLKPEMLVDTEKMSELLFQHGVFRKANHDDWLWSRIAFNKKKARKAAKRLLNKCLLNHSVTKKEEEKQHYEDMMEDFDHLDSYLHEHEDADEGIKTDIEKIRQGWPKIEKNKEDTDTNKEEPCSLGDLLRLKISRE